MKQLKDNVICKYCLGCNKLENENFMGLEECKNFVNDMNTFVKLTKLDKDRCEVVGEVAGEPTGEKVYGYLERGGYILQLRETAETKCCGVGAFKIKEDSLRIFEGVYNKELNMYVKEND